MTRLLKVEENGAKLEGAHAGSLPQLVSDEQYQ
jgi:hypothetical protein